MALCNLNWKLELTFRTSKVEQVNCHLLITCRYSGIYRGGRQGASWEDIRDPGQERWRQSGGGWVHQGGPPHKVDSNPPSLHQGCLLDKQLLEMLNGSPTAVVSQDTAAADWAQDRAICCYHMKPIEKYILSIESCIHPVCLIGTRTR